jgi:hypothetical protein
VHHFTPRKVTPFVLGYDNPRLQSRRLGRKALWIQECVLALRIRGAVNVWPKTSNTGTTSVTPGTWSFIIFDYSGFQGCMGRRVS